MTDHNIDGFQREVGMPTEFVDATDSDTAEETAAEVTSDQAPATQEQFAFTYAKLVNQLQQEAEGKPVFLIVEQALEAKPVLDPSKVVDLTVKLLTASEANREAIREKREEIGLSETQEERNLYEVSKRCSVFLFVYEEMLARG